MALLSISLTTWQGGARYAVRRTFVSDKGEYQSGEVSALWVPRYTTPPTFGQSVTDLLHWAEAQAVSPTIL